MHHKKSGRIAARTLIKLIEKQRKGRQDRFPPEIKQQIKHKSPGQNKRDIKTADQNQQSRQQNNR